MNIDKYKRQFIQDVLEKFDLQKNGLIKKKKLAIEMNLLLHSSNFNLLDFINDNDFINKIVEILDLEDLKIRFLKLTNELQRISIIDFVKGNDYVNNVKEQYLSLLNEISIYFSNSKAYYNIDGFIDKINSISEEFVVVDRYFIIFLERIGIDKEEILKFISIVTKENIKVCNKKIDKIKESEQLAKQEELKKQKKKEERKRRKNILSKKITDETKNLLDNVSKLIEEKEFKFTEAIINKANAYEDFFLRDITFLPEELVNLKDIESCLFILIWEIFYDIDDKKDDNTEQELRQEISKLSILYSNYISITKKATLYEDSMKENYEKTNNVNIVYVIDDRNNDSYFSNSINQSRADSNFIKNANSIINKLKKGINKQKKPINDIPNCYYILQGLTYVSIIMLNDENYIVLTASKWDNLFSETRNIYNNNIEQINDLRKQLVGDKYE